MSYIGDFRVGVTLYHNFSTRQFSTGSTIGFDSTPDLIVFKDDGISGTDDGVVIDESFGGFNGLTNVAVDLTSNPTFYSAGSDFVVVIDNGSVDGVDITGEVLFSFSIENRSALMPTVANRRLDVTTTGEAGLDWANIGSPTTAQNLSATNIDPDQVVASVTGAVGSVTGAVGSVTGNVGGSVGSVVGSVGGNVNGSVGGNVVGSVASVVGSVGGNVNGNVNGDVNGNIGGNLVGSIGALTQAAIAQFFTTDSGETYASSVAGSVVQEIADNAGGASLTVQDIVDGVWDEPRADHVDVGTFGEGAASVQGDVTGSVGGNLGGNVLGDIVGDVQGNVDGSVNSVTDPVTVGTNNDKTGYAIGIGGIDSSSFDAGAIDAAAIDNSTGDDIADRILSRDLQGGSSITSRNVRNALRPNRNRVVITDLGVVTVYQEDDSTPAWTGTAVRDAAAFPITQIDPA